MGKHKEDQCLLADQFGLNTSKTLIKRKGKLDVCANVQKSCCTAETWKNLSNTWTKHKNNLNLKTEAKIRIVRLITLLTKPFSAKVKNCVKGSPKLKKKLEKKRRMIDVPISKKNDSPVSGNSDCTLNVNNFRKLTKEIEASRAQYEISRRQCTAELLKEKSRLLCASCDSKSRISILPFLKAVLVSSKDMAAIGNACKKAYYFEYRNLRKFAIVSFGIIKNAYGISLKKEDYLES
jgi:hypothetical protein